MQQVFLQHAFDDIFRGAHHIKVLMAAFDFRQHDLIDVESLVNDPDFLSGLLFIPFRKVHQHLFVYVVGPVVNLEDFLAGFLVVAGCEQRQTNGQQQCFYIRKVFFH